MTHNQLVSLPAAAKAKGMSEALLRYYLHSGRAPVPVELSGRYYFDAAEIALWEPEKMKPGRKKKDVGDERG